jgi:REP element-mobilizing transposase RayT
MRRRLYIESGGLYEITLRTRRGLPFPPNHLIQFLIKAALARTQRDSKVYLCHFVWMGNHAHLLVVSRDARSMTAFYGELKKRITDYLKRLLGYEHLTLWDDSSSPIRIADYAAAIERIAYFYANPARANLVDSIEQYPGYSSYHAFNSVKETLYARQIDSGYWVRCPAVTRLNSLSLPEPEDKGLVATLQNGAKRLRFATFPHLWLRCFGLTTQEDVRDAKMAVLEQCNSLEQEAREQRTLKGIKVIGAKHLARQPIDKTHTPKKRTQRIFVIARDKLIRMDYIKMVKDICDLCAECYQRWKRGDFAFIWPPGTFPPPYPMSANALA